MKLFTTAILTIVTALSTGAAASAQDSSKVSSEDQWLVEERDREVMHAGMPFELIGIDEGDTDFRQRTPALANTDLAVAYVDPKENYERRLAMYNEKARFHAPLAAAPSAFGKSSETPDRASIAKSPPSEGVDKAAAVQDESDLNLTPYLLAAGVLGLLLYRRRMHS